MNGLEKYISQLQVWTTTCSLNAGVLHGRGGNYYVKLLNLYVYTCKFLRVCE